MTLVSCVASLADVKSESGQINFDVDDNGTRDASLNNTGFGIGISAQTNLHVSGNGIISANVGVGGDPTENTLHVTGTISHTPQVFNGGTMDIAAYGLSLIDTSSSDGMVTLPSVGDASGRVYKIKKITGEGNLLFHANGNLIDTTLTLSIEEDTSSSTLASLSLLSDGSQWWILSYDGPAVQAVAGSNLLIQYKLNETSGSTAADNSGNNRDGTLLNSHDFSGNTVSGPEGTALSLDDPEDTLNYNHGTDLVTTGYSWSLWVNSVIDPDSIPTYNTANPTGDVLGFNWSSSNTIWRKAAFHQKSDGIHVQAQLTTDISANTWYHIAATWDGTNLKAYLNGSLEATTAVTSLMGQSGNLNLSNPGSEPTSTTGIDHFQFYNRALSDLEVTTIYNSGSP